MAWKYCTTPPMNKEQFGSLQWKQSSAADAVLATSLLSRPKLAGVNYIWEFSRDSPALEAKLASLRWNSNYSMGRSLLHTHNTNTNFSLRLRRGDFTLARTLRDLCAKDLRQHKLHFNLHLMHSLQQHFTQNAYFYLLFKAQTHTFHTFFTSSL